MLALLTALHAIAAALWVGGMFFAFMVLRPAAPPEPNVRLALWSRALARFFPFVWVFIAVLVATGYGMTGIGVRQTWPVVAMQVIGWVMFALFAVLAFRELPALRRGVENGDLPAAGAAMGRIRPLVATNLVLGIVVVALGASARHLA